MAITNFQRTVWSTKIQTVLETVSGLKNNCDYQFEGEIKLAKEVKILGVTRPTIRTYVPGTPLTREGGTDSSQLLKIDQFKYFDIEVEDVDKAQSVKGLMDTLVSEAGKGLAEEADKYIASLTATVENVSSSYEISGATIVAEIEKGFKKLYENNCKVNDTFYLEVTPAFFTALRPALTELYTNNVDMLKKGIVGKLNNAYVSISNLLHNDETDDYCILRTSKAIAYAGQIDKVEAYRPHDAFSDAVKGLYVFGAKVVRPEQIYIIKAHEKAATPSV